MKVGSEALLMGSNLCNMECESLHVIHLFIVNFSSDHLVMKFPFIWCIYRIHIQAFSLSLCMRTGSREDLHDELV